MTMRARLFALIPATWLSLVLLAFAFWIHAPGSALRALLWLVIVYLLPVACFRLHQLAWPMVEGKTRLDAPGYVPWWGAHQLQLMYTAFPALEAALRLFPGVYSAWLRLWGSHIGRGVYWTPCVEISDRSLLEVGDGVIFGHRSACYAHVVQRRGEGLVLYLRRIRIGQGVQLGAGSRLGPGASIAAGVVLPALTDVGVGRRVRT
ncbi:MAG: acyl transferase [Gammaproteobacteria bacterium]